MITFDDFRNEWQGRRIDYDHTFGYQCVDLIRQYFLECFGLAGGGGVSTAIAYWTSTPADVLGKFVRDGSGNVEKGDIVILRTLGHTDYSGDGHIGIATGNGDPNGIEILEQNGAGSSTGLGQDAVRTRFVPRNRVAGVLRPIPQAPEITFQRTTFSSPKWVQPRAGVHKWDLNLIHPTFQAVADNWVDTATGEPRQVQGMLVRSDFPQYQYYLEDINQNYGWNVADAPDYIPPAPKPPAAPEPIPLAEKYSLVTTVMYFPTAKDAQERRPTAISSVDKGEYYVVGRDEQAVKLSKDNKSDIGWVNTFDNKVEQPKVIEVATPQVATLPVDPPPSHDEMVDASDNSVPVATFISTKKFFYINPDHQPHKYRYTGSTTTEAKELDDRHDPLSLNPNWTGDCTFFAMEDGQPYYIADKLLNTPEQWHFGIDKNLLEPYKQKPLDLNHDNKVNTQDVKTAWETFIETPLNRGYTLIKDVIPVVKSVQNSERFTQLKKGVVDGITKRKVPK